MCVWGCHVELREVFLQHRVPVRGCRPLSQLLLPAALGEVGGWVGEDVGPWEPHRRAGSGRPSVFSIRLLQPLACTFFKSCSSVFTQEHVGKIAAEPPFASVPLFDVDKPAPG